MLRSKLSILLLAAAALLGSGFAWEQVHAKDYYGPDGEKLPYTPVVTPNGFFRRALRPVDTLTRPFFYDVGHIGKPAFLGDRCAA